MKLCVLASGSGGNATVISDDKTTILIDAGLSGKEIEKRLGMVGYDIKNIAGIAITHEHSDHTSSAGILSRRYNIPIFIKKTTQDVCKKLGEVSNVINFEKDFQIGTIKISPFPVKHNAVDPVGFVINDMIGVATDLGCAPVLVIERLRRCCALVLEANHDIEMLDNGVYPQELKDAVKSDYGHLSNAQAGLLLSSMGDNLRYVFLAHMSQKNNTEEKAMQTIKKHNEGWMIGIEMATQEKPTRVVSVERLFDELNFKKLFDGGKRADIKFPNGYEIAVCTGREFCDDYFYPYMIKVLEGAAFEFDKNNICKGMNICYLNKVNVERYLTHIKALKGAGNENNDR